MVTTPEVIPVTTPDKEPTVAVAIAPLTHMPPLTPSVNVVESLVHIVDAPVMVVGDNVTVTIFVAVQPVGSV